MPGSKYLVNTYDSGRAGLSKLSMKDRMDHFQEKIFKTLGVFKDNHGIARDSPLQTGLFARPFGFYNGYV